MSLDIEFKRGEFQAFRATERIHLGGPELNVEKGDVVEFDGHVVRFAGGEYKVPPMRASIGEGWFVPESDTTTTYRPKSAQVEVRPAQSANNERGEPMQVTTVVDDERDVGSIDDVRKRASQDRPRASKPGRRVMEVEAQGTEGKVIARVKTPAKFGEQEVNISNAQRIANQTRQMDNSGRRGVEVLVEPAKKAEATGDVQEARTGFDLDDLLPGAVSTEKPAAGVVAEPEPRHTMTAAERQAEARRQERMTKALADEFEDVTPEPPPPNPLLPGIIALIPDFAWDVDRPLKERVIDALRNHDPNSVYFRAIMAVETDEGRAKIAKIMKQL